MLDLDNDLRARVREQLLKLANDLPFLADATGLSRKRASEAIETLVEQGFTSPCKVAKGRGSRELDGFLLAHQEVNE